MIPTNEPIKTWADVLPSRPRKPVVVSALIQQVQLARKRWLSSFEHGYKYNIQNHSLKILELLESALRTHRGIWQNTIARQLTMIEQDEIEMNECHCTGVNSMLCPTCWWHKEQRKVDRDEEMPY